MISPTVAETNERESSLVLIVNQAGSVLQAHKIFTGLREKGFIVEELIYNGGNPETFYRANASEFLDEIKILVAGVGAPARELINVALNLRTIVTTDPIYRDTTYFNGGQRRVDVVYISRDDVSHDDTTKMILDYLKPQAPIIR